MNSQCLDAFAALREEIAIEAASTPASILEAQRFRHVVFCEERDILPSRNAIESDEFDAHARHIVLRRRSTGELVGTTRLIAPGLSPDTMGFPMQRVADPSVLNGLPLATTAEISRFGLSRSRRHSSHVSDPIMRLGLMQGILRVSTELGLTHWCAAMEPSLLRLLRTVSIHFEPRGPLVEYRGLRQPSVGCIDAILQRGKQEKPAIWAFVTGNDTPGWPEQPAMAA